MRSGQNNTCGRGGNELEEMPKMCSAEHGPLKWNGSSRKILLRCLLKCLSSERDGYHPADPDVTTRCKHWIGLCYVYVDQFIPLLNRRCIVGLNIFCKE